MFFAYMFATEAGQIIELGHQATFSSVDNRQITADFAIPADFSLKSFCVIFGFLNENIKNLFVTVSCLLLHNPN